MTAIGVQTTANRRAPPSGVAPLAEFVAASGMRSVVLGTSKDPNRKVTVLLLPPGGARAVLAVKVPTTRAAARAVETERRMLLQLHRTSGWDDLPTVPRVHGTVAHEGLEAVVLTAVPGVPMTTSYLRWRHTARAARVRADFAAVGTWLASFQRATAREAQPVRMDDAIRARLRERFSGDPSLDADVERLDELHAVLRDDAVRPAAIHGDFWLGNVLVQEGCVSGVVDWEAASAAGDPVRDLVRFAHMYALYLDRRTVPGHRVAGHRGLRAGAWGAAAAFAIDGAGWFPEIFREFLRDGLRRLGASPDTWRAAALAGIAEVAATTDDADFAQRHLELFRRLVRDRLNRGRTA